MLLYFTPWRAVTASRLTVYGMLKPELACACGLAFCRWFHSLARGHGLLAHRVRHAEARARLRLWIGVLPLVPLPHAFQHAAQRGLVRRSEERRVGKEC